jgi:Uncharacterised protein family UPF0005.
LFLVHSDSSTKQHLQNVYGCLTLGMLAATAGAYLQLTQAMFQSTLVMLLSSVGAFGFLIYVMSTKNQINSNRNRTGAFIGFTLCTGHFFFLFFLHDIHTQQVQRLQRTHIRSFKISQKQNVQTMIG